MLKRESRQRFGESQLSTARVTIFTVFQGSLFFLTGQLLWLGIPNVSSAGQASEHYLFAQAITRQTILELNDLPPGFEVAPPLLQLFISRAIERTRVDLKKANISLGEIASFVDVGEAEMVTGVTMFLPDQTARESFDAQLKRADGREIFQSGFQQVLGFLGKAKTSELEEIESLEKVGERARGYRMEAEVENFPLRVFADSLVFRRRGTGILLIVGSLGQRSERVSIRDLALKLDRRLQGNHLPTKE